MRAHVRISIGLAIALAIGLPIGGARLARAQIACDPRVMCAGEAFVYSGGPQGRAALVGAIDQATAPMNFIVRPIARERLRDRNPVYERISIRCNAGAIEITVPQRPVFHSPETGAPAPWRGPDAVTYRLTQRFDRGHIEQEVRSPDGTRHNEFTASADGRSLTMSVRITSPRLPRAVEYVLLYRR